MYINRKAMKDNILESHQHILDRFRDELYNEVDQLSSNNREFNHKAITLLLDSYIKKIYQISPDVAESVLYEPYLANYIYFLTTVNLYTEINTYGYTYPEFVFDTFKEYLWKNTFDLSFDQVTSSNNSEFSIILDEANSYGNTINKRRNKNLSDNTFYKIEKSSYKREYSYGSKTGKPGTVYHPIRLEKRSEFEMITILTKLNQTQNTAKLQEAIDWFTFNRYEEIGIEISELQLAELRKTYHNIDWHKPISYNKFVTLHRFMYDYYYHFSDFKALDMYALEKKLCFQGINAIIKTWKLYTSQIADNVSVNEDFLIEMANSVLTLPSFYLRLKHLHEMHNSMVSQKHIGITTLQKRAADAIISINLKSSYTIDTILQALELFTSSCTTDQYDILLNPLAKLIDIYSDKFTLSTNEIPIDRDTEAIFQKLYRSLYPPYPPQQRAKRKPGYK